MTILYFVTALLVLLSRLQTPEAKTGYSLLLNFGGCKCDPNWVCPDGRTWVSQNGITMGFERPGVLRGRRTRLCNHLSANWRTFVHFSAQNKYCIKNLENGKYFYELVMGDCKFNTYNKLNIDDQVTVAHYQTDNQPKLFTGLLTVSNKQLCLWDPRTPLANRDTILEIVDGCGYPQPTRVSVMKLVQVTVSTPCSSSPCKNNGTCTVKGTGFTCKCATGYTGTTCTTKPTVSSNTSACNDNKCKNGSICKANTSSSSNSSTPGSSTASIGPGGNSSSSSSSSSSSTGYTCSCKPGYTGTYCQTPTVSCSSSSCTNGTCKVSNNKITCTCSANWYGDKCDTQCNDSHKCTNGSCKSVTTNGVTVKKCSCKSGWYGEYCNVQCNAANPCKHGTCTSTTVSGNKVSVCKCKSGWTGASCNQETAVIVREEKVFVKLGNKRVCITLRKEGSTWTYYRENKKTGEMETFNPPPGFKWQVYLNGETVIIQGKQATKKSPHAHLVTVKIHGKSVKLLLQLEKGKWVPYYKKNGTWTCFHPPPGFSLTVKIGNDIIRIKPEQTYQKVKITAHGKQVLIYMMRVNNHWTPFYKKNGVLRSYHAPMGTHVMVRIGHEETVIEHRKPCSTKPCKNGGSCTDEGVTFHCACGANWSGASCDEMRKVPACQRNTCGPHGTCIELGHNTVQCHCRKGWAGVRCNIAITCPPLSCSNGGIMVHLHNSAHCQCPVGFVGKCCQKRVPACSLDPCNKRGLCEQTGHNYKCHCHAPYTGMNCEIVRRVRQCIVGIQRFAVGHIMRQNCNRCVCLEDGHLVCTKRRCPDMHFVAPRHVKAEIFEGHLCGHSPCVHGGCRSFHFRPRCQCQQGYTGTTCETEIHVEQVQHVYHRRTYEHHSVELHRHHPTFVEHREAGAEVYRHHPVLVQHREPVYYHHRHHRRVVDDRQYHHPIIHRDVIVQGPVEREHVEYVDICGRVDCGRGSCNVLNRQPHCICRHGWDGATCMNRVHIEYRHRSPCSSVRCHHGGSCITRWRQASCMCPQQFSGQMCEIDLGRTHYFGR